MPSGFSVGRVLELVQKGRESASSAERPLHFQIVVDPKVPRWIAQTVKDAFVPEQGGATVDVSGLVGAVRVAPGVDAALVLAGGSDDLVAAAAGQSAREPHGKGCPIYLSVHKNLHILQEA